MKARQIFILGSRQTGACVGNLLESHPEVAAVASGRNRGVHESLFFSHFARAWDWTDAAARRDAMQAFLDSDFASLMQLHDRELCPVRNAETAAAAFAAAMDTFAWTMGARAWVETTPDHVRHARDIAEAMPEARFVAIRRDTVSAMAAWAEQGGPWAPRGWRRRVECLRVAAKNAIHNRRIDRLARRFPDRVVRIEFDRFRQGGEATRADLVARLGLEAAPGLRPRFGGDALPKVVPPGRVETAIARTADFVVQAIPELVLSAADAAAAARRIVFPAWVWRHAGQRPSRIAVATPPPDRAALSSA